MDTHDVGRGRNGVEAALRSITAKSLIMGIDTDILYPISEQEKIAKLIPSAEFAVINSAEGHDGFLLEQQQVGRHIEAFLSRI